MKDSLFEMLLNLFEKTLTQLKEKHAKKNAPEDNDEAPGAQLEAKLALVKLAKQDSIRIFTPDEQTKLTKASYQFLMRLSSLGVIAPEAMELIINQLLFSGSRFVSLEETKWVIRKTLAHSLDPNQLAFLDLLLYQKEDNLPLH